MFAFALFTCSVLLVCFACCCFVCCFALFVFVCLFVCYFALFEKVFHRRGEEEIVGVEMKKSETPACGRF